MLPTSSPKSRYLVHLSLVAALTTSLLAPTDAQASAFVPGCDFNGDGFDDLASGSPGDTELGTLPDGAGTVNVLYGTAAGLDTGNDQLWSQDTPGVKDAAEPKPHVFAPSEGFGSALDCGDFNGDGFDDLAIAVPGETVLGTSHVGAVHVLFGSSSGLTSHRDQFWHMGVIGGHEITHAGAFGAALAAGDFDGDGYVDLAIGGPETDTVSTDAGIVVVLHGDTNGLTDVGSQIWDQSNPFVQGAPGMDENFGAALAGGHFDLNNFADLAIGVPGDELLSEGGVNVLYGGIAGLGVVGNQLWTQDAAGIVPGNEPFDLCGFAVAAGDFNGDGEDDLAMGCPGEGIGENQVWEGAVVVIHSCGADLLCPNGSLFLHQDSPGVTGKPASGDHFGAALIAGYFGDDPFADLGVGVPGETDDVSGIPSAGATHLFYGAAGGLVLSPAAFLFQDNFLLDGVSEPHDEFGAFLNAGDFNGDGRSDLAIAIPEDDPIGFAGGAVQVVHGRAGGITLIDSQLWHQDVPQIEGTQESSQHFGHLSDDPEVP